MKASGLDEPTTCPCCGCAVRIEGRVTKYYAPIAEEQNEKMRKVIMELLESAEDWHNCYIPLAIVERMKDAVK